MGEDTAIGEEEKGGVVLYQTPDGQISLDVKLENETQDTCLYYEPENQLRCLQFMNADTVKVMSQLQNLCARQECCSRDIYAKALKRLDGDSCAAMEILQKLKDDRYVDDLRYAKAFSRDKSSLTGWGPYKIRLALKAKGMDDEVISEALSGIDDACASDKLAGLLSVKARSLSSDPQRRLKLIRFALSRGYEYSQVEKALAALEKKLSDGHQ